MDFFTQLCWTVFDHFMTRFSYYLYNPFETKKLTDCEPVQVCIK